MNREQLKQRIVGAIVLVALGVIFIPMILNHDATNSGISGSNIPVKPETLTALSQQPMSTPPPVPAEPTETRTLVDKDTPSLPTATPPTAPPSGQKTVSPTKKPDVPISTASKPKTTRGWVVQLASFTERKTALRLRDRVRKAGYTCYVEAVSSKRRTLYRVRVGPVIKRKEAETLQKKIARQLRVKGSMIMAHP